MNLRTEQSRRCGRDTQCWGLPSSGLQVRCIMLWCCSTLYAAAALAVEWYSDAQCRVPHCWHSAGTATLRCCGPLRNSTRSAGHNQQAAAQQHLHGPQAQHLMVTAVVQYLAETPALLFAGEPAYFTSSGAVRDLSQVDCTYTGRFKPQGVAVTPSQGAPNRSHIAPGPMQRYLWQGGCMHRL